MGTSLVTIWGFIWLEKCHKLGIQGGAAGFSPGKDDYLGKIQSQSVVGPLCMQSQQAVICVDRPGQRKFRSYEWIK